MKYFPIHIIIKDCSYLFFYFLIMKFNLTNETFSPSMISNFPGATKITFSDIILGSFLYSFAAMAFSLVFYFPIYWILKKTLNNKNFRLIFTGFVLTSSTPLLYIFFNGYDEHLKHLYIAEIISWILTFVISILFYFVVNNTNQQKHL